MKLSRWNSYIRIGEKSGLIYNAFTDSFVVVKEHADDFCYSAVGEIGFFSPIFESQMLSAGALVENDVDEVAALAELIEKVDNDDSFLQIIVNPTLDCNFHCWYCYEEHVKASVMAHSVRNAIVLFIKKRIEEKNLKYIHMSFFGGEPLMQFDEVAKPLIFDAGEICRERGINMTVHFTTNSYLLTDEMIGFLKNYETSFQITLDGGRDNHNNTRFGERRAPSFDIILRNIRKLSYLGCKVAMRINYTSKVIDSTKEIVEILSGWPDQCRHNICVDYQRVWQDGRKQQDDTYKKVCKFRRQLNEMGYHTANNRLFDHVRNSCYADKKNELLINFNGDIFACTARDFKPENRLGILLENGDVQWNESICNRRNTSKFSKQKCRNCRIAPICGGGCRTKCMEHSHHDGCNLGYSDKEIDELIMERFEERFMDYKY